MHAVYLLSIILSAAVFGYAVLKKKSRKLQLLKTFSGPKILPIVDVRLKTLTDYHRQYGNRMVITCSPVTLVILSHPDDVEKILSSREHINKPSIYDMLFTPWLGSSMFYAKGQKYFNMRKMILPAMSSKIIERTAFAANQHSRTLVNILKDRELKGISPEIHWLFILISLDITFDFSIGKSMGCLQNLEHEYAVAIHNETMHLFERIFTPWLWPEFLWKISPLGRREKTNRNILHAYIDKIVQNRKKEIAAQNAGSMEETQLKEKGHLNFIDLLIREQQRGQYGITDKYIRDEINASMFAGHETVSSCLTWTIYLLCTNPEAQTKLHLELDEAFGSDKNRDLQFSELSQLKFLDCCIKESLRLYPSGPMYVRAIEKDLELDKDTTIPGGINVIITPWLTHRLPEFFPEPDKFIPDRFSPENYNQKHPFAYIPFSAGPRNCIGQKMAPVMLKIVLAHIFRNFLVELANPEAKVNPVANVVLFPENGLQIRLKLR
ncbi:unnamed protein product [Allacma fusca]|uniref:Cytochrome P450 n=1 Tax=Allacma fusca TaxID=39272 RepID=A0A8J2PGZ1_9HEXA|nr:unnamed protein product [Allacma fusca]